MGLNVYKLDLDQFRAIQGSGYSDLIEQVLEKNHDLIEEHDKIHSGCFTQYLTLAEAIRQIIGGKINKSAVPLFQYEHAAALIAATIGEPLDPGLLREGKPVLWEEADIVLRDRLRREGLPESAFPSIDHLFDRGPLLEVPIDLLNPLGTGYLTAEEVRQAKELIRSLNLDDKIGLECLSSGEEALDVLRSYCSWIIDAAETGHSLFFHA